MSTPLLFVAGSEDGKFVRLGRAMAEKAGWQGGQGRTGPVVADESCGTGETTADAGVQSRASPRACASLEPSAEEHVGRGSVSDAGGGCARSAGGAVSIVTAAFVEVAASGHAVHLERPEALAQLVIKWCRTS